MPVWFSNLLYWSAQVALLVAASAALPRFFRIQQPRVLLAYWRALLVLSFALPAIQPWYKVAGIVELAIAPESPDWRVLPLPSVAVAHWHFPAREVAMVIGATILCGIVVRVFLLVAGLLKLKEFRLRSEPISVSSEAGELLEAMRGRVGCDAEFRLSANVESPVTFGLSKPTILLPEPFPNMKAELQSAIACHELLHVRRRDWAIHLVEELIRGVVWFHPAIVWLVALNRLAREQVVDQQVLKLTGARKPYLEALLGFATDRRRLSAIPAPPFLAERQLAQRVALMLKEVRMSRTRLMISFAAIAGLVGVAATSAVWMFPLKARAQNAPSTGVAGGFSGGVTEGVAGGIEGGIARGVVGGVPRGIGIGGQADVPEVDRSTIWIATVKRGPMVFQVRGLGELTRLDGSAKLIARISLPDAMTRDVRADQSAVVDTRKGVVQGHVSTVGKSTGGVRSVDIALDGSLPEGAVAGLAIDGVIDMEKVEDVVNVGRPIHGTAGASLSLFKLTDGGDEAVRVKVKLGRASVQSIEVVDGLKVGDRIILSDTSAWDGVERIRLK
jgi:beta-lactamase regulating signal transducer with metallopeptidase domain